ncbi:MAG: hypothetical protein JSV88_32455 [Candidatus Aminicenantes bacterium]|nr:MAG: hypothetical protein JSV88_32455 [Candidatus Aminicenantes bacterium]
MSKIVIQGLGGRSPGAVTDDIIRVEQAAWRENMQANTAHINERLQIFSAGLWQLIEKDKIAAFAYFIRLDEDFIISSPSWFKLTSNGTGATHKKDGNALFGVTLGSLKAGAGKYLLRRVFQKVDHNVYKGVKKVYACSRIPTLHKHFNPPEKVNITANDPIIVKDPGVRFFLDLKFKPIMLVPGCYHVDEESLGYAVIICREVGR